MSYTPPDFAARSLRVHELVAEIITRDPGKIELARETLLRWINNGSGASQPYFTEWLQAINGGLNACLKKMLERSEHGDVLRSCSPFGCLISPKQRQEIFDQFRSPV